MNREQRALPKQEGKTMGNKLMALVVGFTLIAGGTAQASSYSDANGRLQQGGHPDDDSQRVVGLGKQDVLLLGAGAFGFSEAPAIAGGSAVLVTWLAYRTNLYRDAAIQDAIHAAIVKRDAAREPGERVLVGSALPY